MAANAIGARMRANANGRAFIPTSKYSGATMARHAMSSTAGARSS